MKKSLILVLIVSSFLMVSQTDSSKVFIKFKNGTILYGSKVSYESHLINSKVKLDGTSYKSTELSFFRDEKGEVYGNLNGFTQSIGNGKGVYFFSTSSTNNSTQNFENSSYSKTNISKQTKYFFSEGFTEIQRVNFSNFQHKMQDDSVSKFLIYKAGRARSVSIISYAVFGSVCFLNFALLSSPTYMESNAVFVLGGVALGGVITGIVYNRIKLKKTQEAINKYYGVYVPIGE